MPPNLGGFFMVRSYYPSECHADYFDFERIEALRSEERFSRNAETDLVCRLLLEKKKTTGPILRCCLLAQLSPTCLPRPPHPLPQPPSVPPQQHHVTSLPSV